jgi:hypothetical protein
MARTRNIYRKIKEVTDQYLLENVGEMAVTGTPHFKKESRRWIVPVLCETQRGILPAGRIELDEELNVVHATPRSDMTHAVEEQLRRLPYLFFADEAELKAKGIDAITINNRQAVVFQLMNLFG